MYSYYQYWWKTKLCSSGEDVVVQLDSCAIFATGPIDHERSPYKWCCRVCRVELSPMGRDVRELLSHYRTGGHLVREHRIRFETPGVPLFDQHENEWLGIALQEAKRRAKEMYPIPLSLNPVNCWLAKKKFARKCCFFFSSVGTVFIDSFPHSI